MQIRSGRRTLAIVIEQDGGVTVRAPFRTSQAEIDNFLSQRAEWIASHKARVLSRILPPLDSTQIRSLKAMAQRDLPARVRRWAELMGVEYARLNIGSAKKRLGSCTSMGVITLSFRLMQYPLPVIDYVVVHELAHRKEMNHSKRFYEVIAQYLPDYKQRIKMMKEAPRAL